MTKSDMFEASTQKSLVGIKLCKKKFKLGPFLQSLFGKAFEEETLTFCHCTFIQ